MGVASLEFPEEPCCMSEAVLCRHAVESPDLQKERPPSFWTPPQKRKGQKAPFEQEKLHA